MVKWKKFRGKMLKRKERNSLLKAFTLAEVLITLGVIGVVAAITIPTLSQNINEMQNKVAWKKEYSTISQVIKMIGVDNKMPYANATELSNDFGNYLSVMKKCNNAITEGCWHTDWYSLEGVKISSSGINTPSFILKDGSLFNIVGWSYPASPPSFANSVIGFLVDVNGFKAPNKIGVDIFGGFIGGDNVIFDTSSCDRTDFSDNQWGADLGCSQKVIAGINY